jgi:hypothetical protein
MSYLIDFSYRSISSNGSSSISSTCNSTEISHFLSQFHTQSRHVSSTIADYLAHSFLLASV